MTSRARSEDGVVHPAGGGGAGTDGAGCRVVPFPGARRVIADYLAVARRRHLVHALVEVDVTLARGVIREHRARTGQSFSFTAFVIACLAAAVDQDRSVQAYRLGRRKLVVFDDVDVCVLVEREAGEGRRIATPHVVRAANRRTFLQIHDALRADQAAGSVRRMSAGGRLPGVAGRWLWRVLQARPRLWKRVSGTVCVTSVGMFGSGAGWGIPIGNHTLMLTVGGIATRPGFGAGGRIEPREYLSLTVSVDHDVVDGAPPASSSGSRSCWRAATASPRRRRNPPRPPPLPRRVRPPWREGATRNQKGADDVTGPDRLRQHRRPDAEDRPAPGRDRAIARAHVGGDG